jgi:hypothetical protein
VFWKKEGVLIAPDGITDGIKVEEGGE